MLVVQANAERTTNAVGWLCTMVVRSLSLLAATASLCNAQPADIKPFQLTGVEGNVSTRYRLDNFEQTSDEDDRTYQTQPTWEEEVFVLTHSYVYHPGFLNMDLGGGLLFVQQNVDSDQGKNDNKESLYNLTAHLNFLEQKPYPVTLFYDRSNPSVNTSLAGSFLVKNTRYGVRSTLQRSISPMAINLEAFRFKSNGDGFSTTIDQTTDQASLRAFRSYGDGNNIMISHLWTEADSKSGSPGLPIQQTVTTTKTTDVNAFNQFGNENQFRLTQLFNYTDQTLDQQDNPSSDLNDVRYSWDMRWLHTDATRSFYQYRFQHSDRGEADTKNHIARIGASYEPPQGLHGNFDLHAGKENQDPTDFERKVYGTQGALGYEREIPRGSMQLGASGRFDRTDQSTGSSGIVQVFDESITLVGTTPVPLANDFVVTGSIVVTNQANTQTFVEGLDYDVVVIGSTTEIQRLIGGNILDGQTVLVDYDHLSGGNVKFNSFNQNYFGNLKVFRFYDFYLRYRRLDQTVKSGQPTTPLNDVENTQVGAQAEYPLYGGWLLGGGVIYEDQDEDISPFTREQYKAWVETPLPKASRLRIMGRREFVDNDNSPEDINTRQLLARLTSRPWLRTVVSAEADYQKDTGGTQIQRRKAAKLVLLWRYRRLQFSVRGEHINNKQGSVIQKNNEIRAQLIRNF